MGSCIHSYMFHLQGRASLPHLVFLTRREVHSQRGWLKVNWRPQILDEILHFSLFFSIVNTNIRRILFSQFVSPTTDLFLKSLKSQTIWHVSHLLEEGQTSYKMSYLRDSWWTIYNETLRLSRIFLLAFSYLLYISSLFYPSEQMCSSRPNAGLSSAAENWQS